MSEKQDKIATCGICGEPMPPGEQMFKYHGFSGPCPVPPKHREPTTEKLVEIQRAKNAQEHGGSSHDDTHTKSDWLNFLDKQLDKAVEAASYMGDDNHLGGRDDYKQRLINIAALAMDAHASIRRIDALSKGQP